MTTTQAEYVSPVEAAVVLACSAKTVHRAIARGDLPAVQYGRSLTRIKKTDLEAFLARHSTGAVVPQGRPRRRPRSAA